MAGYNKSRFVRTSLPDELLCKICQQVLREPINCQNCKIWACIGCSSTACTHKGEEKHEYTEVNKYLKSKIDDMLIRCKYWQYSCLTIQKVKEIENHERTCECAKYALENPHLIDQKTVEQCPFSMIECSEGCHKQMKLHEKHDHKCLEWLLEVIKNLEIKVGILEKENSELKTENDQVKSDFKKKSQESDEEILRLRNENEFLAKENDTLDNFLKEEIAQAEGKTLERMKVFHENAETRLKGFNVKASFDHQVLEKKMNDHISTYLGNVEKNLRDFNMKIDSEIKDLIHIPEDMKEFDKSPLKQAVLENSANKALNKSTTPAKGISNVLNASRTGSTPVKN